MYGNTIRWANLIIQAVSRGLSVQMTQCVLQPELAALSHSQQRHGGCLGYEISSPGDPSSLPHYTTLQRCWSSKPGHMSVRNTEIKHRLFGGSCKSVESNFIAIWVRPTVRKLNKVTASEKWYANAVNLPTRGLQSLYIQFDQMKEKLP